MSIINLYLVVVWSRWNVRNIHHERQQIIYVDVVFFSSGGIDKEPRAVQCAWYGDDANAVMETVVEGTRLPQDTGKSSWRTILTEMEAEGCVDFHINSHTARRPEGSLQAADTPDHFEIAPMAENPLVYKYPPLGPGRVVKQSNAANLFTVQQLASGRLEMVWRIAFSSEDLEHSPKKPLWLLKEEQPLATGQCIRLV